MREVRVFDVPGAISTTCLIFDSDYVVRRFWIYPELWAVLTDDALDDFAEGGRDSRMSFEPATSEKRPE